MKYLVATSLFAALITPAMAKVEDVPTISDQKFQELANTDYKNNLSVFKDVCLKNKGTLKFYPDAKDEAHKWGCEFIIDKKK